MDKKSYTIMAIVLIGLAIAVLNFSRKKVQTQQEAVDDAIKKTISSGHIKLKGELILDSMVDDARKRNNHFLFNLRYGMTKQEYNDSLNSLSNYKEGRIIMRFNKDEMRFTVNPAFENEYLQSIELTSVISEININSNLKEQDPNESLCQRPLFTLPYIETSTFDSLISLYQVKYGYPLISKGPKKIQALNPDIINYVEWITKFNRSQNSDGDNKRDSMVKYKKYVADINETLNTDTLVFRNNQTKDIIQLWYTNRSSISKIQLSPASLKKSRCKEVHIFYTPADLVKYKSAIQLWESSLQEGFKQNDKDENEKLKQKTKEGI